MHNGIIKWFGLYVPPVTTDHTKDNDMTSQMKGSVGLDEPDEVKARHWVQEICYVQVGTHD